MHLPIILLSLLGFYSFAERINYFIFNNKNNLVLNIFSFSLIFFIIYLINTYLFLLNIDSKFFSIAFSAASLFLGGFFLRHNYSKIFNFIHENFSKKTILISVISFFFIADLIPSDEDSIRYHLEIPQKIIDGTFYINHWFDYLGIGANEFVNLFGLQLNFTNTSSYLNFVYLFFIVLSNNYFFKEKKIGSDWVGNTIVLSSPYIIALVASQKMYLLPCYICAYTIAYIHIFKNKISYRESLLIIFLNIFAVVSKVTLFPFLIIAVIYILLTTDFGLKNKIYLLIFSGAIFVIAQLPLLIIKYQIYQDPFLPIISINELNFEWWNVYSKQVFTASNMDFTDQLSKFYQLILIPVKLIVPLQPTDLFRTLGIGMFFVYFLDYKKNKHLLLLIVLFLLSILILNNYQSRWFLPLLLFISVFAKEIKFKFINNLAKLQMVCSLIVTVPLAFFITVPGKLNMEDKIFDQKKIIMTMNNKYKNEQYFSNFNSFFYLKNEVPVYIHQKNILNTYDSKFFDKNSKVKLFLYQNRDGSFEEFSKKNLKCNDYQLIETFHYNGRRFFVIPTKGQLHLYRLFC